jgi:hypothetical protein
MSHFSNPGPCREGHPDGRNNRRGVVAIVVFGSLAWLFLIVGVPALVGFLSNLIVGQ